jgi:hypothetical protein
LGLRKPDYSIEINYFRKRSELSNDVKPVMELCRAVAPSGAIKVDAGVKAKARQEAQKVKAQARKGSIPIRMVQQSYSRGAPVSASASSASAATVRSTKTQYWGSNENSTF